MSKTSKTPHTIDGSAMQDAFHYALAACGGEALGYESAFCGEIGKGQNHVANRNNTRSTYLRLAVKKARQAFGYNLMTCGFKRRLNLASAPELARRILEQGKLHGYDANGGVRLCQSCSSEQQDHGCDGLCRSCYNAGPLADAKLEAAIAAREARDAVKQRPVCKRCGFTSDLHIVGFCMPGAVATNPSPSAPKPLPAIPPVMLALTGVDLARLLHAVERLQGDLAAEGVDPTTRPDVAAQIERQLGECEAVRNKLIGAIDMP